MNVHNLDEIDKIIEFAYQHRLLAVNFELPIGDEAFVIENKEIIRNKLQQASKIAKKNGVMINPFHRITCNRNGYIIPNIRLNGDIYPCCNGMNQTIKIGNIFEDDFKTVWKNYFEGKELRKDMCLDCNLVKNMYRFLY